MLEANGDSKNVLLVNLFTHLFQFSEWLTSLSNRQADASRQRPKCRIECFWVLSMIFCLRLVQLHGWHNRPILLASVQLLALSDWLLFQGCRWYFRKFSEIFLNIKLPENLQPYVMAFCWTTARSSSLSSIFYFQFFSHPRFYEGLKIMITIILAVDRLSTAMHHKIC